MTRSNYNSLVEEHADSLLRFIVYVIRDRAKSEDIVQDVFLKVWQKRKEIDSKTAKSYLFTIGHNLAISHIRANNRHPELEITLELENKTEDHSAKGYSNESEIVWQELERLSPIAKSLIILRDWEGYSYQEIAQITSLSEGQVKIGIHRARERLKERLQKIL